MTNAYSQQLTTEQEQQLLESYTGLQRLSADCRVPAVKAAVVAALAELRVALDGQAVEFDYYDAFDYGGRAEAARPLGACPVDGVAA